MKNKLNIALYIVLALATVGIVVTVVNINNGKLKNSPNVNWVESGKHIVDNKELKENEYVLKATGKEASYKVIENKIEVATDNINNQSYITLKKGQTVKLKNVKMCNVSDAPLYKPKDGIYEAGMYKVGRDLKPAKYVLKSEKSGYYSIISDSKGSISSIIKSENFVVKKEVTLEKGQYINLIDATLQKINS